MHFSHCAHQVPYQTGADPGIGLTLAHTVEPAADKLAAEKSADQNREGCDLPAQAGEEAEGDYEGHGRMYRQNPAERKLTLIIPPIAERNVDDKNDCRYC